MNNETCKTIRLLLVDYSDGVLPADQVQLADEHLADCAACREELLLLDRSLQLAREVWNEANSGTDVISVSAKMGLSLSPRTIPQRRAIPRKILWIAGSLAVCVAVIFVAIGPTIFSRNKSTGIAPQPNTLAMNNTAQSNAAQPKDEIDVMEYIAREDRSARLAASVELLASQPSLSHYKENAKRYLIETYPDTVAAQTLSKQ